MKFQKPKNHRDKTNISIGSSLNKKRTTSVSGCCLQKVDIHRSMRYAMEIRQADGLQNPFKAGDRTSTLRLQLVTRLAIVSPAKEVVNDS